ncbi:hypothetical protein [Lichenifustis flavocetrariae]|uniref:Uncharacterized protein n=1 Tax=Lichenifustis flavocetrariae TaxID=2949735 RepID=A0AA42CRP6_9HYPH|nr:hypothetical protein [Lichenifustis flavocetrariae]MCW6512707.1 hypothetical protein [Lichenifustis flavocetrariae]
MATQPCDMRLEDDGTWARYDIDTDLPAVVNGIPPGQLGGEKAVDLVEQLNELERNTVSEMPRQMEQ